MQNHINVTNVIRFQSLMGMIKEVSPFTSNVIYKSLQQRFPRVWGEYCHEESEASALACHDVALQCLHLSLDPAMVANLLDRHNHAMTYIEIAQYNQLDSEEQEEQDLFWEKSDEQSDFDDKVNMYYNEY